MPNKELYKIISELTIEQLGISINQAVENDNYRILGDIKVAYIKDKVLYIALMVKENNENNENKKIKLRRKYYGTLGFNKRRR